MRIATLLVFFFILPNFYSQVDVSVETSAGKLYGTILADSNQKENPIIYFIGGSGASTRNGIGDSQLQLANALFENNIYSLSVDKRGAGKSAEALISENDIRIDTLVNDAVKWINYLKEKGYHNIIVAGHSQGSLIGMLAAQKTPVNKFISLAGAGRGIDIVLKEQLSGMLPVFRDSAYSVIDSLKKGVLLDSISPYLYSLFRPSVQPFITSWISFDPVEEIKKISIPILIIQGTTDLQVKVEDANLLHDANSNSELHIIKKMNHVFRNAPMDKTENSATYTDASIPINQKLIKVMVNFAN